ncbi:unnamed protein product [Rangifer tarandus platyrhynchus]|uniref:Uncharacterized protein n=1 Tax=Rangifer tarandus platyrhynchus TaxID=3082113 RepID=A0AC60A2Q6_RANTA
MTAFTEHSVAPTLRQFSDRARRLLSFGTTSPPSLAFGRWQGHPSLSAGARESASIGDRGERLFKVHAHNKCNPSWGLGARPRAGGWSPGLGCGSPSSGPGSTLNHRGTLGPTGLSGPQFLL